MNSRQIRSRKVFRLESLEVRSAPSHFGVLAHAALAVRPVHAAAHVRIVHAAHNTESNPSIDKSRDSSVKETNPGVDSSADSTSKDPSSVDTTSKDPSSLDNKTDG